MKIIKISTEFEMTIHDFPEGTMLSLVVNV